MTIELLPLPPSATVSRGYVTIPIEALDENTRLCVEHNVAANDAEIETLRAEVGRWRTEATEVANGSAVAIEQAEARAERLAEALREARDYVATALLEERAKFAGHEDCSDIPGIEADLHKIDTALRDHDQGVGNG